MNPYLDRSKKKYPMLIPNPSTKGLPYYEQTYAVWWDEYTISEWQSYAACYHEVMQGLGLHPNLTASKD